MGLLGPWAGTWVPRGHLGPWFPGPPWAQPKAQREKESGPKNISVFICFPLFFFHFPPTNFRKCSSVPLYFPLYVPSMFTKFRPFPFSFRLFSFCVHACIFVDSYLYFLYFPSMFLFHRAQQILCGRAQQKNRF